MSEEVLRIEKLENGFEVEVRVKPTKKDKGAGLAEYQDPWKAYAFTTDKEVIAFVTRHLASLPKSSEDEFNDAADAAFKE